MGHAVFHHIDYSMQGLACFLTQYEHGWFASVFAVVQRQSECGRNDRQLHVSQLVTIGVYYVAFFSFLQIVFRLHNCQDILLIILWLLVLNTLLPCLCFQVFVKD